MLRDSQRRFLFEYRHDGAEWALELWARDLEDAKAKVRAIPWATYRGEIAVSGRIPNGWISKLIARITRPSTQSL